MTIDRSIIGEVAAKFLDGLEGTYGENGTLDAVLMIIAVDNGEKDDTVEFRAYDGQGNGLAGWKAKGLLSMVSDSIGPGS
jgi:hypothetical protein